MPESMRSLKIVAKDIKCNNDEEWRLKTRELFLKEIFEKDFREILEVETIFDHTSSTFAKVLFNISGNWFEMRESNDWYSWSLSPVTPCCKSGQIFENDNYEFKYLCKTCGKDCGKVYNPIYLTRQNLLEDDETIELVNEFFRGSFNDEYDTLNSFLATASITEFVKQFICYKTFHKVCEKFAPHNRLVR